MGRASNVRRFVHLRVHSTYSLGLGLSSPADVCLFASRAGYDSVALTDVNGTYGYVAFHHAARALGIKPIYGTLIVLDSRVDESAPPDERHTLTLLALDRTGLRNVCAAASVSASKRERGESVSLTDLHGFGDGVVCIVGLPATVTAMLPRSSRSVLLELRARFGDRVYVEAPTHVPGPLLESRRQLETLAGTLRVPRVLCQDVRFVGQEKHELIDLIGSGDESGGGHEGDALAGTHGMLTPDEMSQFFDRDEEAFTNASLIAASVQPDILGALGTSDHTLKAAPGVGGDVDEVFVERVRAAFDREFDASGGAERALWKSRLDEEIEIVLGTGLSDAFVEFEQIIGRLRARGGAPGPSTGLRLQSLCAYLLGITAFNPYTVDAHFQPFFDERDRANRVLDLQLPSGSRWRAIEALRSLYDESGMGYVPSVEHITASRALKMVAKRLESRPSEFDEVVRIATHTPGASLQDLCTQNRRVGFLYKKSALLREAISHAAAIEGLPYGFIRSRRTLIISPTPIGDFLGQTTNPETGERFVQSTRDSFPIGSIARIDVTTLTALTVCARFGIGVAGRKGRVAWEASIEHRDIYRRIEQGDVDGVYLLETELVQRLARDFGVASFDDLTCFLALMRYRRGGTSLADRVAAYRDDTRERPPVPREIQGILGTTNGWVLFHDQLRDMVAAVTGLDPLNSAQMVRRFARHRPGELAALRQEFMMFSVEWGTPMEVATTVFTRILHSVGAVVSRQQIIAEALIVSAMLYLSRRQQAEFFAALVNVHRGNDTRRDAYLERLAGVAPLLAVDINRSGVEYRVEHTGVRPPLWAVAGVGEESARRIVASRGKEKIRTPRELDCLIEDAGINYNVVEALVRAGALDSAGLPANATVRRRRAKAPRDDSARARPANQLQFELGKPGPSPGGDDVRDVPPPSGPSESAEIVGNKRGGYHVLTALAEFHPHPIASGVELAGRIRDLRRFETSSGENVALFTLYDSGASVPVYVSWERVGQPGEPLADGDHVSVRGRVRNRDGRRVCEADEVERGEGGINHGTTAPDQSAAGDS